jgi:hypothetical protein
MSEYRNALQAWSNAAADNISAPVDGIAWLLRKAGIPVPNNALMGSDWMRQRGLTAPVEQGAGQVVGDTLGLLSPFAVQAAAPQIARGLLAVERNALAPRAPGMVGAQRGAVVYHGSPHKFDAFDSSKIGTGEGAQAYGHGLYLAENPGVAESYKVALSSGARGSDAPKFKAIGGELQGVGSDVAHDIAQGGMKALDARMQEVQSVLQDTASYAFEAKHMGKAAADESLGFWKRELDSLQRLKATGDLSTLQGQLYKVDLPDEKIARMLDWDKPLSQQAPEVRAAIARSPLAEVARMGVPSEKGARAVTMGEAYERLSGKAGANISLGLRDAGIPGIRYLDGGSRGAGSGTSNFVVFPGEENALRILERNGGPLGK